jgi:hypothetical protein
MPAAWPLLKDHALYQHWTSIPSRALPGELAYTAAEWPPMRLIVCSNEPFKGN